MSFLSDAFEGNFSHLGTDLSHAGSSLMNHPSELYETLGGAAALATGGLALGALPELGAGAGLLGAGADSGILTGGAALGVDPAAYAAASEAGTEALGYGTQVASGLTNAAGESLGSIDPLAQGAAGATDTGIGTGIDPLSQTAFSAPGSAPGAAGPAATPPPGGNFMDTLTSPSQWTLPGVGKGLGVAAAGAGLGMNMLRGNQVDPNQQKLADMAQQLGSQGQVLESYLKTGKLPPALQASLDQAKASAKARLISGYAQRGQPTDPKLNSALAQELNNLDLQAVADMAKIQVDMLNTGLKESGMSMELYTMLTKMDEQQNQDLMKSIQSMAMALGGGFGGSKAA